MVDAGPRAAAHPDHDALAAELRRWYTESVPEMAITVEPTWFGYLSDADGPAHPRVLLTVDEPDEVPSALAAATATLGVPGCSVWVDDRSRAGRLEHALVAAGCRPVRSVTNLALVGSIDADRRTDDLEVVVVGDDLLEAWATTKLAGFADADVPPTRAQLDREVGTRRRERTGAELWLATLRGEPVAVLGYYTGPDQLVFNLATLARLRHRGIARSLLRRLADAAAAQGCRSVMISAEDPGRPAALYRALGFVDEVYWTRRYECGAPPPP